MISPDFLTACRATAFGWHRPPTLPPDFSDFGLKDPSADNTRHSVDPGRISDSEYEALTYYAGLPSEPILVCRTGNTSWKRPTGFGAYGVLREAMPVFDHQIATVWDNLGPKVPDYLDSVGVPWTSIDVVRFRVVDVGEDPGPVVLRIGVKPQSLSGEDARVAAIGCQGLLREFEITDVDVEFRESIFTRSAGPKLLKHVYRRN